VQRRLPLKIAATRVDQGRMAVQQTGKLVGMAVLGGVEHARDQPAQLWRSCVALLELAGEQLDRLVAILLGDLVHRAAVRIGAARIETGFDGAADRFDVAVARGVEHFFAQWAVGAGLVHVLLQPAPAGKTVVACHAKLGSGQARRGVGFTQRLQPLLGFILQVFEIRLRGQSAARPGWRIAH
jgi:hypothetical protein